MTEGSWKGAHNVEAQLLPQPNGSRICGNYEVELHGQEAELCCNGLCVLAHDGCDAMATRQLRDHEAAVAYMVAVTRLVCLDVVGAKDLPRLVAGNKRGFRSNGAYLGRRPRVLPHVILLPDASPTMLPAGPDVPRDHAAAPEPTS